MKKFPFHIKLFAIVSILFVGFVIFVYLFQLDREREYSKKRMEVSLAVINQMVNGSFQDSTTQYTEIDRLLEIIANADLRITIVNCSGKVLYDNGMQNVEEMDNHLDRPEMQDALLKSEGGIAIRYSQSLQRESLYFAQRYKDVIVRASLPYNQTTIKDLSANATFANYLMLTGALILLVMMVFSYRLGKGISQLRLVTEMARRDEPIEDLPRLQQSDLGRIALDITAIYKRLRKTRDDLSIEKEKLIKHLSLTKEGLAFFDPLKNEILANSLFIQYSNFIASQEVCRSEEIFFLQEFEEMTAFINNAQDGGHQGQLLSSPFYISKGGKTFVLQCIVFEDSSFEIAIADRTQQEAEQELKRELTQNISHELKTPVSSIQGYLETILQNKEMDEEQKSFFMDRCYAQTVRLTGLLADISVLHRLDDVNRNVEKESLDLHKLIENVSDDVILEVREKRIKLSLDIPSQMRLNGNYSLLYSVFRNLIDNALSYAGEGVTIYINCYREDDNYLYFRFADSGIGVTEEHLNRIFERFYRVDKGRSRKLGGTGLGLAIVKNAILVHQGDISARNRKGGGLEFLFTLHR